MLYHATVLTNDNEIFSDHYDVVLLDDILASLKKMCPCGIKRLAVKESGSKYGYIYSLENGELKAMDKWEMLFLEEALIDRRLRCATYQINELFERYTMPSEELQKAVYTLYKEFGTYLASAQEKKANGENQCKQ